MTTNQSLAKAAVNAGNINAVINGSAAYETKLVRRDVVNIQGTEVVAWANTGTVSVTTAGVATFGTAPTPAAVGDTIVISGALYTITAKNSSTEFVLSPAPATAISGANFVLNNAGSYVDFLPANMDGLRLIPEELRVRFGGSGTLSVTWQFERVNATTGVATAVTTAVATTAAAVWTGVAAAVTPQTYLAKDEFLRLRLTSVTTVTAGRTCEVEFGMARTVGPNLQ